MTAPLLYACHFGGGIWSRLARTLAATAARHCADWTIQIETMPPPAPYKHASDGERANTAKLDRWTEVIAAAADGDQVLLLDADTIILRSLDAVWDHAFDVAYTVRPTASRFPLNAGVVFVRVTDRSRAFLRAWRDENRRMLHDPIYHMRWRRKYAGMNQAALGSLLESKTCPEAALARLPCQEWNCEDSGWEHFDPAVTRILHIKSQLRLAIFHGVVPGRPYLRPLVKRWRALEPGALEPGTAGVVG